MNKQVSEVQTEKEALVISSKRQLFVDDYLIQNRSNVIQKLHQVAKYKDNPIVHPDRPWEGPQVQIGTVIRDEEEGIWKMWYTSVNDAPAQMGWQSYEYSILCCYAISEDGIHWKKPKLGIFGYKGSTDNNMILRNHHSLGAKKAGAVGYVLKDINDPDPGKRYKMVVWQRNWDLETKKVPMGLYIAFSLDGIHWKENLEPIFRFPETGDASGQIMYDPKRKKYVMFAKRDTWKGKVLPCQHVEDIAKKEFKRSRMISESDDFIHWTKPRLMLAPDEEDPADDHFYSNTGFYYESIYLGFLPIYHTKRSDRTFDVQLICSRDGQNWERAANRDIILPSGEINSDWDGGCLGISNNPPIRIGDKLWIYYSGCPQRHGEKGYKERTLTGCIGLSKLRLDGFVSLDSKEEEGVIVTKPLKFTGKGLFLNADARKGIIQVELLDKDSKVIPGYGRKLCSGMSMDKTKYLVSWKDKANLTLLQDKQIRLKFYMKNSSLYSFWFDFIW